MNLENVIKNASQTLKDHNISSYMLDAEVILSNIMGVSKEYLIAKNKKTLSEKIIKKYNIAIKRRIKNEPTAYILGKKEFWSEDFLVNRKTLIPRPESELIIYKLVILENSKSSNNLHTLNRNLVQQMHK